MGTVTTAATATEATTWDGYAADNRENEFEDENKQEEGESNNLHLDVHGNTIATLAHLHVWYVMMNMLQN
jgi:GTP cyclohydrolase III